MYAIRSYYAVTVNGTLWVFIHIGSSVIVGIGVFIIGNAVIVGISWRHLIHAFINVTDAVIVVVRVDAA